MSSTHSHQPTVERGARHLERHSLGDVEGAASGNPVETLKSGAQTPEFHHYYIAGL
jgi:hypothetical protein